MSCACVYPLQFQLLLSLSLSFSLLADDVTRPIVSRAGGRWGGGGV